MTIPEPGEPILVEIAGEMFELKYPMRVLREMDAEYGINFFKGADHLTSPARLSILLYFGLKTRRNDITLEWVEENVEARALPAIMPILVYATTGKVMEERPANPPPLAVSGITGSHSGQPQGTTSELVSPNSGS